MSQVDKLVSKQAVEEVLSPSAGFYSRLFLAPKKNGEWRPVLDLSPLNQFITAPRFQMETALSIMRSLRLDHWATSLDLKDAFLHVPIAPRHRRYLRFRVGERHFQFRSLPFGLTTSPYVFTRVAKAVGSFVHSRGLALLLYLDDWSSSSPSEELAHQFHVWLSAITEYLGFLINHEKSDPVPSQVFQFIGILFDLIRGLARPADHRVEAFLDLARRFLARPDPPASMWQQLLGHLTSLEKLVPRGRLHMRPLQFALRNQWQQELDSPSQAISLDQPALQALLWWMDRAHLVQGVPLRLSDPVHRVFTDASTQGWGAHLDVADGPQAEGLWSAEQLSWHINNLELMAVWLALQQFLHHLRGSAVLAMTDNTTVVGQISHQGGTHSRSLYNLTCQLLTWCDLHHITLSALHIPGRLNVVADRLSRRHQVINTEWSLSPQVVLQLWQLWGRPHVDLFATRDNAKLPTYVSPLPDEQAWKQDALSFPWTGLWAYAFPPFALMPIVLQKMREHPCELILVAPRWPARTWYPDLLDFLVDFPFQLPLLPSLLRQPDSHIVHLHLDLLNLHAWRLSSHPSRTRVSPLDLLGT
jgi:ribonuclease HI